MGALVWKKEAGSYSVGIQPTQPSADQPSTSNVQQAVQQQDAQKQASQQQQQPQQQPQTQQQRQAHKRPLPAEAATRQPPKGSCGPSISQAHSPNKRPRLSAAAAPYQPLEQQQVRHQAHAPASSSQTGGAADQHAAGPQSTRAPAQQHIGSAKGAASTPTGAPSKMNNHARPSAAQHGSVAAGHPPHRQPSSPHKPPASTHQHKSNMRTHPAQLHKQQQQQQQQRQGPRAQGPCAAPMQPHPHHSAGVHKRPHGPAKHQTQQQLQAKESELEALRARITAAEAAAAAKAAAEAARAAKVERERAAERQAAEEMRQRRARLNSAFAPAFEAAAKADVAAAPPDAAAAAGEAERAADDAKEVARVLAAKGDWEALGLGQGSGGALLKKRYRELAVRLHPDKCRADDATAAFQRVHRAYQALSKFVV